MKAAFWWRVTVLLCSGGSGFALPITTSPPDGHQVTCSQGLSRCTVKETHPLFRADRGSAGSAVAGLEARAELCCQQGGDCRPCLRVDVRLNRGSLEREEEKEENEEEEEEEGGSSGVRREQDDGSDVRRRAAHLRVCYTPSGLLTACKRVEFTVTAAGLDGAEAWLSLVALDPDRVLFGCVLTVAVASLQRVVLVPTVDEVCRSDDRKRVRRCDVPRLAAVLDRERGAVLLGVEGGSEDGSRPSSMCLQQERDGACMNLTEKTIPLHSVTPCLCFQVWWRKEDQRSHRSATCPFRNHSKLFQRNVWENVSVSVALGRMSSGGAMLSWNLSAPCRLEAEVWPCQRRGGCRETQGSRQRLSNHTWRENSGGRWQVPGAFQDVQPRPDVCMMVRVKGMNNNLGPFCPNDTSRWRWSVLLLLTGLLVCVAVLGLCFLHKTVKRAGYRGHVVVLSPPDAEGCVWQQVCELSSLLQAQGFSVCVDLWCRAQQCSLGPLPWLHSQLQLLNPRGGRALLVLHGSAWERAREWGRTLRQEPEAGEAGEREGEEEEEEEVAGARGPSSPYSDVFSASLSCIQADRQQGRAGERFALVTFQASGVVGPGAGGSDRGLPELLQGLPRFHLPFQRQGLLSALAEGGRGAGGGGLGWRWTEELKGGLSAGGEGLLRGLCCTCIDPEGEKKHKETGPL